MTDAEFNKVLQQLTLVFQDLFDDNEIELDADTTAADIEGWDSLTNIRLLIQIEREFKITFNSSEIADMADIGELVALIVVKS